MPDGAQMDPQDVLNVRKTGFIFSYSYTRNCRLQLDVNGYEICIVTVGLTDTCRLYYMIASIYGIIL